MKKFDAILAVLLVVALAAALAGYVHFERMMPEISAWTTYVYATLLAKLSMTLSGLIVLVAVILTAVGAFQPRTTGSTNGAWLVALVLSLGGLTTSVLAAMMGNMAIQQAIAITGATDPRASAPGYVEVMLVLILGLLAPVIVTVGGALLSARRGDLPAEPQG
jgi:hypothetical protein